MVGLRILEIGEHCLFKRAWPDRTDFVFTASNFEQWLNPPFPDLDPRRAGDLRDAVAGHAYDLLVLHAPAYPPWGRVRLRQCLASLRRGYRGTVSRSFLPFTIGASRAPIVVLDMEDQAIIYRHNVRLLDRCTAYFKRELPTDQARLFLSSSPPALPTEAQRRDPLMAIRLARVHPISLGLSAERIVAIPDTAEKETDIFFAGQSIGSSTVRERGIEELKELARLGYKIDIATRLLPWKEFAQRCARAHLVWSPEGLGWDCFRHYEAAACRSVPLVSQPVVHRHRPLLEGIHCFHYGVETGGLVRAARAALREPERLCRMAEAGRRHVLRHHTHSRLCDYVVATSLPDRPHQ
jgi:hypothetical protein